MSTADPFPLPGIVVEPGGQTVSVTILSPGGTAPSVYSDAFGVNAVSMPDTISARTTFYVVGEGPWLVNGQPVALDDSQVATVNLGPRPVFSLGGTTSTPAQIPYYNVKDFGATGNGTTDDTAAINLAFAQAAARFGWVYFPPGTYIVASVPGAGGAQLQPPSLINGLHIVGAGAGESIIKSTITASFSQALTNFGNEVGWVIEGLELQGGGVQNVFGATIATGEQYSPNFGQGNSGLFLNFLTDSTIRDCKISGFTTGIHCYATIGCYFLNDHSFNNRNTNIAILDATYNLVSGGMYQTAGASNMTASEVCANILLANQVNGSAGPVGVTVDVPIIDEIDLNMLSGGASLYVAAGTDCEIRARQVFTPGKKQASGSNYYGIRIGPGSVRTVVSSTRVQPFTVDATRVPNNTILIESGATDTVLENISTNPNAANGGGDLSDSGTRTVYKNVVLNGAPALYTTPPAGTVTVSSNAGTVPVNAPVSNFTNSSAATMTITMATSGAIDGQTSVVRVYDFSAASQTISWVNTENSTVSAPTTSAGSTTLPKTVTFQYNGATSKWRCIEAV